MFQSPGNIAFTLGSVDIHWYGIIMSFSILLGLFTILFIKKRHFNEITTDSICDLSFYLIIYGILSARLYYVILDYKYFINHPLEILAIWNGGLSIQGAIIGGVITAIYFAKKHNLKFLRYADLFSFGLVIGQIAGRWGNFFNSEAFGLPTNLPWKLFIPFKARPLEYRTEDFFHPAFLYESLLSCFIFIVLYLVLTKYKKRENGFIFYLYIVLYSIARMIVETIRIDSVLSFGNIHMAHITSFIFILIGITAIISQRKRSV